MQQIQMTNELVRVHCYSGTVFKRLRVFSLLSGAAAARQHPEGGGTGHRRPAGRPERTSHHLMHLCRHAISRGRLGGRLWRCPGDAPQRRDPHPGRGVHHHGDVPTGGVGEDASQPGEGAGGDGVEVAAGLLETVQPRLHLGQSDASVRTGGRPERFRCGKCSVRYQPEN